MLCDFWARICIDWKQWESALCLRWDGDTSFIEPSQWQWIHFCQFVVIYQTKSNAFIQSKQKNDAPHLQASASVSAHFPVSINQISTQLTVTDTQWMSEIWCDLWGWDTESSSLTSNQSINESIRVVTRKSVRNVNDKIMEYKMLWNWISKKTLIIITSWESVKHDWLSVSQLSLSLTVSQVK